MRNEGNRWSWGTVFGRDDALRFQPGVHGHEWAVVAKGSRVVVGYLDGGVLDLHEHFAAQAAAGWKMPEAWAGDIAAFLAERGEG